MRWLRLAVGLLSMAGLGCTTGGTTWAGSPPPPPLTTSPILRGQQGQADAVKPASYVAPHLRSATSDDFGLPEPSGTITASVMARVNGQPILVEEVMGAAGPRLMEMHSTVPEARWPQLQAEIIRGTLDELINRELILQDVAAKVHPRMLQRAREAAEKEFNHEMRKRKEQLKVTSDEEFRAYLEKRQVSLDEMRRQKERDFIATEYMRSVVRAKAEADIGREQLLEYYRQNLKEFDKVERVVWQHIFIDVDDVQRFPDHEAARRHAEQVLAQVKAIRSHEQFAVLAEKYSYGPSKYRNGEGEGNERGMIRPPEVEEIIFKLKPGQAGPIVEVPRGFHIVRLVDHQPAGKVPFEVAVGEIRRKLQNKVAQAEYDRVVKELRSKAYIETGLNK